MNYYRRYVGDYLKKTARLSMIEHGAYNLLLDYYYADEQPLPLDKDELYTMVRAMTPADRKAVDKVLRTFFTQQADGYHNKRADHEIEVSQKARTNGKGGGRPKTETVTGYETGMETDLETGEITGGQTEEGGGSGHPPTTNLKPLTTTPKTPVVPLSPELPPVGRTSRGTRLPKDWLLPKAWGEWALTEKPELTPERIRAIADRFRDYWIAKTGKDATKADWLATWRNWIREESERNARSSGNAKTERFHPATAIRKAREAAERSLDNPAAGTVSDDVRPSLPEPFSR